MNSNKYIEECKKELPDSTFYKQIDESNIQKQNNVKKRNYQPESTWPQTSYQNISNLHEYQSSTDYVKYLIALKNYHHLDQYSPASNVSQDMLTPS